MERIRWSAVGGYDGVYEGVYEVSDAGDVRSLARTIVDRNGVQRTRPACDLTPGRDPNGRRVVTLFYRGHRRSVRVYRLVAQAFVPNPEGKPEVNHLNGDCSDDRSSNLEWCTRAENMAHAAATGLMRAGGVAGDEHPNAKLSSADVREMRRLARAGDRPAALRIAAERGVTRRTGLDAIAGRSWAHLPLNGSTEGQP